MPTKKLLLLLASHYKSDSSAKNLRKLTSYQSVNEAVFKTLSEKSGFKTTFSSKVLPSWKNCRYIRQVEHDYILAHKKAVQWFVSNLLFLQYTLTSNALAKAKAPGFSKRFLPAMKVFSRKFSPSFFAFSKHRISDFAIIWKKKLLWRRLINNENVGNDAAHSWLHLLRKWGKKNFF